MSITAAMRLLDRQDAPRLRHAAPGVDFDLDTIVTKCLQREPGRRYADAGELAADIRRFLGDVPITASPPDRAYLTRKFIKRNRILVGGAAATLLTLTAGVIVASVFAVGKHRARLAADASDLEARTQRATLLAREYQDAADLSVAGDVFGAIERLEGIPAGVRGWGWDLLATGLPRWMPGNHEFGGVRDAGYLELTSGFPEAVGARGSQVLCIADRQLSRWDPLTGRSEVLFPDTTYDTVARGAESESPYVSLSVAPNHLHQFGEVQRLNTVTLDREPISAILQPSLHTRLV